MSDNITPSSVSPAEFERRRVESEIARNNAERAKLEAEALEVTLRSKQKWYSGRILVQAVVGGVVASALMATWVIGYLQPVLRKDEEVSKLELKRIELANAVESETNRLERQENERKTKTIVVENERVKLELASLLTQNQDLHKLQVALEARAEAQRVRFAQLSVTYDDLARRYKATADERRQLQILARQAEAEGRKAAEEAKAARMQTAATRDRVENITEQLATRAIRGTSVNIMYAEKRALDAATIAKRLTALGAQVDSHRTFGGEPTSQFARKLYYFNDNEHDAASQIAAAIRDVETVQVTRNVDPFYKQTTVLTLWVL